MIILILTRRKWERLMSAFSDLTDGIAALSTAIGNAETAIHDHPPGSGTADSDIQGATASIASLTIRVQAIADSANGQPVTTGS
jgi:hypothetical protein